MRMLNFFYLSMAFSFVSILVRTKKKIDVLRIWANNFIIEKVYEVCIDVTQLQIPEVLIAFVAAADLFAYRVFFTHKDIALHRLLFLNTEAQSYKCRDSQ